jgi:hypothetical protein
VVDSKISVPTDVQIAKGSLFHRLPIVLMALGVLTLIYWLTLCQAEPSRALFGYLFGFTAVLSVALGCLAFVLIQHVTRAGWSVAVRRIAEVSIATFPLFIILFIPIALGMHDIFPWTHTDHLDEILQKKTGFLNDSFFLIRSFGYLLTWTVLGVWYYKVSVSQDNGNQFNKTKSMQAISAPAIFAFALTLTFASFDWLMSLQPHWYSTIFGVYFFAGCLLAGLAFMTLVAMALQNAGVLKTAITGDHYHDLGKLIFGFTVFWAYISFSQFMLYWYAGIPEEIEFYTHRLHHGWETLSWAIPVIHFFIPFFTLMSRFLKRVKLVLAINCLWILAVHLVDLYWLILPNYGAISNKASHFHIELVDILGLFGIAAIFLGFFFLILVRAKVLAVGDPRLKESLAFENF